jgi:hypothetical protein
MIANHYGHEIVIANYTDLEGEPTNYSVECMDCFEVLFDEEVTK